MPEWVMEEDGSHKNLFMSCCLLYASTQVIYVLNKTLVSHLFQHIFPFQDLLKFRLIIWAEKEVPQVKVSMHDL